MVGRDRDLTYSRSHLRVSCSAKPSGDKSRKSPLKFHESPQISHGTSHHGMRVARVNQGHSIVRFCSGADMCGRTAMSAIPSKRGCAVHYLIFAKDQLRTHAAQQKEDRYSTTSSARACIDGGTLMPSALAVLRFITRSNLVGCCTGRSAGFAPSRIFAT